MRTSLARLSGAAIIGAFSLGVAAQTTSYPTAAPPAIPPQQAEKPATAAPEIAAPETSAPPALAAPNEPIAGPKVEQNSPTPDKAPSSDSPQLTTNAPAQALAEYDASRAFCMRQAEGKRDACLSEAEEGYHRALKGDNPGQQGNPGSIVGEKGTPRS